MDTLTDAELAILEFEGLWWKYAGSKEAAIKECLHLSPTRYYQKLNKLLDGEAALKQNPLLVNRLRRLRSRQATR